MKKKQIILFASIFCLTIIIGCSREPDLNKNQVVLNVCTSFGEGDGHYDTYQNLIRDFEKNSGVLVADHSEISSEEWKGNVLSSFSSREEPDVLFFFTGQDAKTLIESQQVVDLDTIRTVYPSYGNNINTSVLNTMKADDGKNYALPVSGYWEGLFINKDLFTQYDLPIPDDWDSFLDTISAFRQNGITPIAVSLGKVPHYWFEFLIYNYSGPAGHLTSAPTADNPLPESWIQGLTDLQTLYRMNAFPENTEELTEMEAVALFQDKKAAMLLDGSWRVGNITDKEQVILIPFPSKGEARINTDMIGGFSMGFYITAKSWNNPDKQKAAVDFINAMTANESILEFNSSGSASPISARTSKGSDPLLQSIITVNSQATAYIGAVQDTIELPVRNAFFEKIPAIASGTLSIEDALNDFFELNDKTIE